MPEPSDPSNLPEAKKPAHLWFPVLERDRPGDYLRFGFWARGSEDRRDSFLEAARREPALPQSVRAILEDVESLSYTPDASDAPDFLDPDRLVQTWIPRLARDTPGDYVRFGFMLRTSPAHRDAFLTVRGAKVSPLPVRAIIKDVEALSYVDAADEPREIENTACDKRARKFALAGIVGALLVFAAAQYLLGTFGPAAGQLYYTEVGVFKRITLDDGTVIELNTNTIVRVLYSETGRQITLPRGEAHFVVAPDAARPFTVDAGRTVTRVLGTEFAVRRDEPSRATVLVTEGRVAVEGVPPNRTMIPLLGETRAARVSRVLRAGERAINNAGRISVSRVDSADIAALGAWRNGRLVFRRQPLSEIVAEFNRYNRRQLVIVDPSIAGRTFSGEFGEKSIDQLLAVLSGRNAGIRVGVSAEDDDVILLSGTRAR